MQSNTCRPNVHICSRKRRTFLGIDPVFVSVPSSSTGGATTAGGSMTSSAYHYGTCIVHRDDIDVRATGRHGSLPTAVFCMGSSPYPLRQQQQQQQQRTATLSSSSAVAYGIVPCSLLSATSGGYDDGDSMEDDDHHQLEPADFGGRTTAAIVADFGVERHFPLQDDVQFYGDDDRFYGEISSATAMPN